MTQNELPACETLRQVVEGRLAVYERAMAEAEAEMRRAIAHIDDITATFIITDGLLRLAERHRLLTAMTAELRDILKFQKAS